MEVTGRTELESIELYHSQNYLLIDDDIDNVNLPVSNMYLSITIYFKKDPFVLARMSS